MKNIRNFLFGTLRGRLILSVAIVHAVMMTLFIVDLTNRQRSMIFDRQEEEANAFAQTLAVSSANWLTSFDIAGLQEIVNAQSRYPELLFAILTDNEGHIMAHTDRSKKGLFLTDLPTNKQLTVICKTPELVDVAAPVVLGNKQVGWARVGIGQKGSEQKIKAITRDGVLYALLAILVGSFIAWIMGRRITRRLYAVQNTMNLISAGNNSARTKLSGTDEPAKLANTFDAMLDILVESEARFKKLFNLAAIPLGLIDKDGMMVGINNRFVQTFGYTLEDMSTISEWWQLAYPDPEYRKWVVSTWEAAVQKALEEKSDIESIEYKVTCKSREVRTVVISGTSINDEVLATFFDITERKQAEETILKANRVYAVISQINQAIVRIDDRDRLFAEVCRIAIEYGKFQMAWIGLIDEETKFVNPVSFAGIEDHYLSTTKKIYALDIPEGHGPTGTAIREGKHFVCDDIGNDPIMAPWKDEALKRGYRSSIALPIKLFGKVIGTFSIYASTNHFFDQTEIELLDEVTNDISFAIEAIETEKMRAKLEEALSKSEARQCKMVTNIGDVIVVIDKDGIITFKSANLEKWFGWKPEELVGKSVWQNVHPGDLDSAQNIFGAILCEPNSTNTTECRYRCKDGSYKWIELTAINLLHDPDIQGILGNYHDITERKQKEQELIIANKELAFHNDEKEKRAVELVIAKEHAEQSDRLKSAFLANMSHEIRTPMNGILGFASILKEPDLTGEQQQEYIEIIEKSGARMLNIINDIVDISKIESGLMEVHLKESNINEQIDYIHTFFKPEIDKKRIRFFSKKSLPEKEAVINTDREKIYAILTNLVKNAIKYTDRGAIEFGYNLKTDIEPVEMEFYVKDTGIGIPKDRQETIFERFIQADIVDKMARQGAGLGLAISKAYVEMLGGKIWVKSEEGKGSTFYFTLPYNTEPGIKNIVQKFFPTDDTENQIKRLKILIVEDDETSEMLIAIGVEKFSKEILKARTGIDAVEICRKNLDIDLILMDIQMPDLNGHEATRQIRQFNKEVVIIAQTAFGLSGNREKAIAAGCNDYIAKPINRAELLALIQKYFK